METQHENRPVGAEGVSFIIPAFNEEGYLPATLDAIRKAATEEEIPYEIIVVDDASTDKTGQIARAQSCKVVEVSLRNIGAVRNAGANAATKQSLIFVDADTLVQPGTLSETIKALNEGAAGGGADVGLSGERVGFIPWLLYLLIRFVWQTLGRWAAGCYMFCKRDIFHEFGGFDEQYFAAEELFFSRQVKRRGKFVIVSTPVITSSRKLQQYSVPQLFRFVLRPLLAGRNALKSRKGLELLYEDRREDRRQSSEGPASSD
ncbi:MAG: glycosyltransferase [Planctomycetota bacterium]